MLDIHTHILPGMDDGSADLEETLGLLRLLKQQGITVVGATSHFYAKQDTPENFLQRREAALAQIPDSEELPRLIPGAEVAYFEGLSRCEALSQLQLGNSKLLMIEMPFDKWTHHMVEEICALPVNLGVTAVLAHVDRYLHRDQMKTYSRYLLEQGVYFQCNAAAFQKFTGRYWALKAIRHKRVHFLGSDCHNMTNRKPCIGDAYARIGKVLGRETIDRFNEEALELLQLT